MRQQVPSCGMYIFLLAAVLFSTSCDSRRAGANNADTRVSLIADDNFINQVSMITTDGKLIYTPRGNDDGGSKGILVGSKIEIRLKTGGTAEITIISGPKVKD